MDTKRTALVLIEYQNDFTSKGGTLHDAVKGVMDQNNMLQNTVETVKKARAAGCTIVHAAKRLQGDHVEGLYRRAECRGTAPRDGKNLPDVLETDEPRRVPRRAVGAEVSDGGGRPRI